MKYEFAKSKNNESANKLITSILIGSNYKIHKPTNMIIFKYLKNSCLKIYRGDETKIIYWICIRSKLI